MLIPLKRLDGKTVFIDSSVIFRVRPGLKALEPAAVSVVHYDPTPETRKYDTLASREALSRVVAGLRKVMPIVGLTSPSKTPVYLDAAKVTAVMPPTKGLHFRGTNAVITVFNQTQQVAETVAEASALIEAARARLAAPVALAESAAPQRAPVRRKAAVRRAKPATRRAQASAGRRAKTGAGRRAARRA